MQHIIQIAGVKNATEVQILVECGVHYIGFPLRLTVHQEDLSENEAAAIIRSLRPPTYGVLITYLSDAKEIYHLCCYLSAAIVQLHGDTSETELLQLKTLAPELQVIKSLIVRGNNFPELKEEVHSLSPYVDAFITDTFDPTTGAWGATGKTHDWNISRKLVELCQRPIILAGGLNPENVYEAICTVRPAGVDAHTGVEDPSGRKSRPLVEAFVAEAQRGFMALFK
jgi:phosphoribosylanthranilate isomerase